MTTSRETPFEGRDALVVGGTGNLGVYLVQGFLRAGARVLVPSRSQQKVDRLLERLGEGAVDRVVGLLGDVSDPAGARALREAAQREAPALRAVVAAPASWHQTPSMLGAGFDDFRSVIETRLYPHYLAAEAFLPLLPEDGAYTTINGPAAFTESPYPGTGAISVAAIAQNKLVAAIAAETGGAPRVNDVVMTAFIGPKGTRSGSPLAGEQVAEFITALSGPAGRGVHGRTLQLKTPGQVERSLLGDFGGPAS